MTLANDPLELEAVNVMLRAIREEEAASLEDAEFAPVVSRAVKVLTRINRNLQSCGFPCNTSVRTITLDSNGEAPAPANCMQLRATDPYKNYRLAQNKVYDVDNDTFVFDAAPEVECILLTTFADMPIEFREWALESATRTFVMDERGDAGGNSGHQRTLEGVSQAKLNFERWIIRNSQPNINNTLRQNLIIDKSFPTVGARYRRYI